MISLVWVLQNAKNDVTNVISSILIVKLWLLKKPPTNADLPSFGDDLFSDDGDEPCHTNEGQLQFALYCHSSVQLKYC